MKKLTKKPLKFLLITLLFLVSNNLFSQASFKYSLRVGYVYSDCGEEPTYILGIPMYLKGEAEHTALIGVSTLETGAEIGPNMLPCQTRDGAGYYAQNLQLLTDQYSKFRWTPFKFYLEAWEDDSGDRCSYDDGSIIGSNDNNHSTYELREELLNYGPPSNGVYYNSEVKVSGQHQFQLQATYKYDATYGNKPSLIPYGSKTEIYDDRYSQIRTHIFYLEAGSTYLFNIFKTRPESTKVNIYDEDGYTLVAQSDYSINDQGTLNFVPNKTGIYFLEHVGNDTRPFLAGGLSYSRTTAPAAPLVNDETVCMGNSAILYAESTGNVKWVKWYDAPTDGNLLSEGTSFTTPILTESSKYYVEQYTDISGLSLRREVNVTVTKPIAITKNISVALNIDGEVTITPQDIDNGSSSFCDATFSIDKSSFNCSNVGPNKVILKVTDKNGNFATAEAIVTIEDKIAPIIITKNSTIQLDKDGNASITPSDIDDGSNDACGVTYSIDKSTFNCSNIGSNKVILKVTDKNGNFTTAEAIVTIEDKIAPVVITKNSTIKLDKDGNASISPSDIDNGSNDACGVTYSIDKSTFNCSNIGSNKVILKVTDKNGNFATEEALVIVEDKIAPIVITKNITIELDNFGKASITPSNIDNGSNDACFINQMILSKSQFDCSNVGENSITLIVTDLNGNIASEAAIVTVKDKISPIVLTKDITIQLDKDGKGKISPSDIDNGSFDACNLQLSIDKTDFSCINTGLNTVTLTGKDASGNITTKTAIVTVEGDVNPLAFKLTSALGTNAQVKCINTAISPITYSTVLGAKGAIFKGFPTGVTPKWEADKVTISGTPTKAGVFDYTISLIGACGKVTGKITVNENTLNLTSAIGSDAQTICVNTPSANITYSTLGATGGTFLGLPLGVTGYWGAPLDNPNAKNQINISGTPSVAGNYTYTVTLTGGCGVIKRTGVITVLPKNTITLTSATGTNAQTKCLNPTTPITNITYKTSSATGATFTNLPAGVKGVWDKNVVTISGTPTVVGLFTYTVTLTGGCAVVTATGTINSTENSINLSSARGTDLQTQCINTAIIPITYTTSIATGATITGLPKGVTGVWASNKFTISGTPTVAGTFEYTITSIGGCSVVTKKGKLIVNQVNTVELSSAVGSNLQTVCANSSIASITYKTTGATGAAFTGLPAGVTGVWANNTVTISGTPTKAGIYAYTAMINGGCTSIFVKGSITVNELNTIALSSAVGTNLQQVCANSSLTPIGYKTTGATNVTFKGLPIGVTGTYSAGVVTISGKTSLLGAFDYEVTATGNCKSVSLLGKITVNPANSIVLKPESGSISQKVCANTTITPITYTTTGATGATFSGLPTGVTGAWANNTVTISGKTTVAGSYTYTVLLTGGCTVVSTKGTLSVSMMNNLNLMSGLASINQTKNINTAISTITYSTTGVVTVNVTGLPIGVSHIVSAGKITITGTPTSVNVSNDYNYQVEMIGLCKTLIQKGTITVINPSLPKPASSFLIGKSVVTVQTYPNPFTSTFRLNMETDSDALVNVRLMDIGGRIIENHDIPVYELSRKEFGTDCSEGVYIIVLTQEETVNTLRVVKQ